MNRPFFLLVALCGLGCIETQGTGTSTIPPDGAGSSGGSALRGDAFPAGAISFFRKVECPADWSPYEPLAGRAIVSAGGDLLRGKLIGEPLASGEERTHAHALTAEVEIFTTQFVAVEGGGNGGLTKSGLYPWTTISAPASAGIPYIQLLACKKMVEPAANALPLPAKLHLYFELDACPSGWQSVKNTEGRIVVAMSKDGVADVAFGGEPMTSAEPRPHTHSFASTLTTEPHGVAFVSGCCGTYAKSGAYPVAGQSDTSAADLPLIALLHCEKL